jgi:hypothetical protein
MKLPFVLIGLGFTAVMLFGCAVEAPQPEGVAFATQIVWQQQYVMGDAQPPAVYWMEPGQLDCADGQGWKPNPLIQANVTLPDCVAGLYYQDDKTAYVALPLGSEISDTAFAHELCHAFMWATTGDGDENHLGPCFNAPGNYVKIANDALARVQL